VTPLLTAIAVATTFPLRIPVADIVWDPITDAEYLSGAKVPRCTVRRLDTGELFSWTVDWRDNSSRFAVCLETFYRDCGFESDRAEIVIYEPRR
jgi:hypothetical protein